MQNSSIPRTAVITGGTGFIGSHLARLLASSGCQVVLLQRRPGSSPASSSGRVLHADLTDIGSVTNILRRENPDVVFHLAGTRGLGDQRSRFTVCSDVNINVTVSLIEAASQAAVPRIIILGSAEEYGNQAGPLHEALPALSDSPYGVTKAAATRIALAMHRLCDSPVVVIRPFTVYGPGQPEDMFVAQAIKAALTNSEFKMSMGTQRRDLILVDDVARGLLSAGAAPAIEGNVINLGSGSAHSLKQVAETIWRLTGATSRIILGGRTASGDALADTWADITLARRLLAWEPRFDLELGLSETIAWMRGMLRGQGLLWRAS